MRSRGRRESPDMNEQPHLLVVDDDDRIRDLLGRFLRDNGFRVSSAADAAEARARLALMRFDLLVLDVMMPGESGYELTRDLRRHMQVPILLLTARSEPGDRIEGLEAGADDYLGKPFEPRELLLRIRSILRRSNAGDPGDSAWIRLGSRRFNVETGELLSPDGVVPLTDSETVLLRTFATSARMTLTRDELLRREAVNGSARAVDTQITRLRRKIEQNSKYPRYLQTVRGKGYVLVPDP